MRPDLVARVAVAIHRISFRQASGILDDVKSRLQLFILGLEGGVYLLQTVGSLRELGKSMKGSWCTHDRRVAGTPLPGLSVIIAVPEMTAKGQLTRPLLPQALISAGGTAN
jgi:hypothetical protein